MEVVNETAAELAMASVHVLSREHEIPQTAFHMDFTESYDFFEDNEGKLQ